MIDFRELFAWCDLHASRRRGWQFDLPVNAHTIYDISYYDRQGFPIPGMWDENGCFVEPTLVWARMKEDREYSRVAWDELPGGGYLSTVWLGLDHGFGGPPLIFETMAFDDRIEEMSLLPFSERTQKYRPSREFPDPETGEMTEQLRYRTEEEAAAAHHEIVRRIRLSEGH